MHPALHADGSHNAGCGAVLGMYAFLSLLMDGPASLATSIVGLKTAPHFDQPYLSSSITDFWSRRWNLTAGNALRFLVQPLPSDTYEATMGLTQTCEIHETWRS